MRFLILALPGVLILLLSYTYYTVASLYYFPGSDAIAGILEFGWVLWMVLLLALVLGVSASYPSEQRRALEVTEATPEKRS